jgi:streptogramin lyase
VGAARVPKTYEVERCVAVEFAQVLGIDDAVPVRVRKDPCRGVSAAVKSSPFSITSGPDGNLWFTEITGDRIGIITTSGVITEIPIPTRTSLPEGITLGPDGRLWFTESVGNKIGAASP